MEPALLIKFCGDTKLDNQSLSMSKALAEKLDSKAKQFISLQFGQSIFTMNVIIDRLQTDDIIKINPVIFDETGIQKNMPYAALKSKQNIRIGPFIGIAANLVPDLVKPFGKQTFFISQLIHQAQAMSAVCFAFRVKEIDFRRAQISGYTLQNNVWKKASFPIPDVIYPRCNNGGSNRQVLRSQLLKAGVRFINPPGIGKWGTFKVLVKNPSLVKFLPDTRLINNFSELDQMLKKYHHIYMKPITGSQGKNIIRVSQDSNTKVYEYQYQIQERQIKAKAYNLPELERNLRVFMGKKRYIAQQQINLLHRDSSIMDLRVMVQKNRTGNWLVTGKVFRIGKPGSITSNISGGGSVADIKEELVSQFNQTIADNIMNVVDYVALETARTLETRLGSIGELGIDVGVDEKGAVWLIEANLKPARKIFSLMEDSATRLLSVRRPIEYAIYLAGF